MPVGPTKLAITLATASSAINAINTINQGQAADRASRFEAERNRQQADQARRIANQRATDTRDVAARRNAALRARVAGSGVTFEGSPLAILSDLAADGELQALRETASGEADARVAEGNARLTRFKGREARRSSFLRAGSTLLTAASNNFG